MTGKRFTLAFDNYDGWAMQDTIGEYSDDEDYFGWLSGQKAVDVMNHFVEENEQLKELIHTMLMQIDAEKIGSKNTVYSARIIFTCEEFLLIKDIWGRR